MSASIHLQLPDGSLRQVPRGTTVAEVAAGIGKGLAKAAVAGVVDGNVVETARPIQGDASLRILTAKDKEALDVLRHSAAHLLAMAVLDLFPGTDLGFGPATDEGFYYDFKTPQTLTEEDLPKIEARMKEIAAEGRPYARVALDRAGAKERLQGIGYELKIPHVDEIPEDEITFYDSGAFTDMCEGPHVPDTSWLANVKLLSVSGAYWRGDASGVPMQRIRGTAFFTAKDLEQHLHRLEEAKKRDHRRIGREMDLFSLQPEGPGFPFWHPRGMVVYNELTKLIREQLERRGYGEVRTPIVLSDELWKRSGHYDHFKDNMYFLEVDERSFAIKPMNCPGTCLVYGHRPRSYRELPVRMAEFSPLHRNELSGTLHGLLRVRLMAQDDAHVYCAPEDLQSEIADMIEMLQQVYPAIGFDPAEVIVKLATKPEKALGDPASWEKAEAALADALRAQGMAFEVNPGEGAFYGPKIEFHVTDALGRTWQCGTIQVDFSMPERFNLSYVGQDGQHHRPVMIHRAILGSFERLIGILIEHHAGRFPVWLAPVQATVLSITEAQGEYAVAVRDRLRAAGVRAEADIRGDKVGSKIRDAILERVPYQLVVGGREMESGQVAVRLLSGEDLGPMAIEDFLARIRHEIDERVA
ncbi:MAG: threonine--tRNA ligase [Planctomycetes bacterium]|nr:threonine--tRNA ligase [Planctomycetota bacterium]MCB9829164.1 threonine--tRNA ligase [Planctomycetota bacterium]MCB9901278.1 threonine--tRNA ligase [Planctomycetota bacterium]